MNDQIISPDALRAIEQLETAKSAANLGRPYAAAAREARRLKLRTPMLDWSFPVLTLAYVAALWSRAPSWVFISLAILCIVVIVQRVRVARTPQAMALSRVRLALSRWAHRVPSMKDNPDRLTEA